MAILVAASSSSVPTRAGPDASSVTSPIKSGPSTERSVMARVAVSPLMLSLELDRSAAIVGESVKARAWVTNAGPHAVRNVAVSLRTDAAAILVRGGRVTVAHLQPGRSAAIGWILCGLVPGTYVVLAQATLDDVTVESPARILVVTDSGGRPRRCQ